MRAVVLLLSLPFGLIVLLLLNLVQRRRPVDALQLHEIGTIVDRALRDFQRLLGPLLALSLVVLPLGFGSGGAALLLFQLTLQAPGAPTPSRIATAVTIVAGVSAFGIGKTVLLCAVGYALQLRSRGAEVTLGAIVRHGRWRQVAGLAAALALPSAAATALGLLGALLMLNVAAAPCVLVEERCGPLQALRRSIALVRPQFRGLLSVLVALWSIGWLLVALPLGGAALLLQRLMGGAAPALADTLLALAALGTIVVAPLLALGVYAFRAFLVARSAEHEVPLGQGIALWREQPRG